MLKESRSIISQKLRDHWSAHLSCWKKSNMRQSDYCRHHRLKVTQFIYWKKKLSIQSTHNPFVSVPMPSAKPSFSSDSSLYIEFRRDYRIRIDKGFDQATLSRVLETLGGL
jgi:hypothetical protein